MRWASGPCLGALRQASLSFHCLFEALALKETRSHRLSPLPQVPPLPETSGVQEDFSQGKKAITVDNKGLEAPTLHFLGAPITMHIALQCWEHNGGLCSMTSFVRMNTMKAASGVSSRKKICRKSIAQHQATSQMTTVSLTPYVLLGPCICMQALTCTCGHTQSHNREGVRETEQHLNIIIINIITDIS